MQDVFYKSIRVGLMLSLFSGLVHADVKRLTGLWQCTDDYGNGVMLKFISRTLLQYGSEQLDYRATDDLILVPNEYGVEEDYLYAFKGKALTIVFPDSTRLSCKALITDKGSAKDSVHGNSAYIKGTMCSWSGSSSSYSGSSYSSSKRVHFDGNGNFSIGSESSFSSTAGSYYDEGGARQTGRYAIDANSVTLRFDDGDVVRLDVKMRQDSGEITELKYGSTLYSKFLCE